MLVWIPNAIMPLYELTKWPMVLLSKGLLTVQLSGELSGLLLLLDRKRRGASVEGRIELQASSGEASLQWGFAEKGRGYISKVCPYIANT
jgi:hypothetical protein